MIMIIIIQQVLFDIMKLSGLNRTVPAMAGAAAPGA